MGNKTAHVILCQWTFKSSPFTTRQYISYNCSHLLKRHHWCCVYSFQFWSLYIFAAEMSDRNAENMQINMCSTRAAVTFGLNDWVQAVQIGFRYFPCKVNPLLLPSDVESGPSVSTQANLSWSPELTDEREFMIMFMLCVFVCFSDLLSSDYVEIYYEGGKPVQLKVWMMHLLFSTSFHSSLCFSL